MGSAGESAATAAALQRALNKFEAFRKSTPELGAAYPAPFVDLGDSVVYTFLLPALSGCPVIGMSGMSSSGKGGGE